MSVTAKKLPNGRWAYFLDGVQASGNRGYKLKRDALKAGARIRTGQPGAVVPPLSVVGKGDSAFPVQWKREGKMLVGRVPWTFAASSPPTTIYVERTPTGYAYTLLLDEGTDGERMLSRASSFPNQQSAQAAALSALNDDLEALGPLSVSMHGFPRADELVSRYAFDAKQAARIKAAFAGEVAPIEVDVDHRDPHVHIEFTVGKNRISTPKSNAILRGGTGQSFDRTWNLFATNFDAAVNALDDLPSQLRPYVTEGGVSYSKAEEANIQFGRDDLEGAERHLERFADFR